MYVVLFLYIIFFFFFFFFSSRRRHTRSLRDWSSDVCSSDLVLGDLLQENYTIASNVGGNVTFSTARPIHRSEALSVLETLLAANGISLVHENNRYSVVLTKDAIPGRLSPTTLPVMSAKGYELRIFP